MFFSVSSVISVVNIVKPLKVTRYQQDDNNHVCNRL